MFLVIGPNPRDPSRVGGVAKYMSYLEEVSKTVNLGIRFYHTDILFLSKLRMLKIGRFLASSLIGFRLIFCSKESVIYLNATLSSNGVFRLLPIVFFSSLRRVPIFLHVHGGYWENLSGKKISRSIWRIVFKKVALVGVFPGSQLNQLTNELGDSKTYPIRNFVEAGKMANPSTEIFRFIFIGRLVPEKGVRELLGAYEKLFKDVKGKVELLVLGSGVLYEECCKAKELNVSTLGFVDSKKVSECLESSHSFVLPSYQEGFPLSFLEAGARGVVSLVTTKSAIPFYFDDGKEFISVESHNVDDLYKKMKNLVETPEMYNSMSKSIYEKVNSEFTIGSTAVNRQFLEVYEKLSSFPKI